MGRARRRGGSRDRDDPGHGAPHAPGLSSRQREPDAPLSGGGDAPRQPSSDVWDAADGCAADAGRSS